MTEIPMKVRTSQPLRKEPRRTSDPPLSPLGETLQVLEGEIVTTGAKPSQEEETEGRKFTWVFVEATEGQLKDLRKGYVSEGALVSADTSVERSRGFEAFAEQVEKERFANACYLQAMLNGTNPAYLYALASVLSGDRWSSTHVQGNGPASASAGGVFRFAGTTWQTLVSAPEAKGLQTDDVKFPNAQCIAAAMVAAKAADHLKGLITDRGLNARDLLLAHLFVDGSNFGANAVARLLRADKNQSCDDFVKAELYPDGALRTAFFARNADIFQANGSATIEQALNICAEKLKAGFATVTELAQALEAKGTDDAACPTSLFKSSIPPEPLAPIFGGTDSTAAGGTSSGTAAGGTTGGTAAGGTAGGAAAGGTSSGAAAGGTSSGAAAGGTTGGAAAGGTTGGAAAGGTTGGAAAGGVGGGIVEGQQNATRRLPVSQSLKDVLEYAGRKTGIDVEVYSGGQPTSGPNRTGSTRHDVGGNRMGAADLFMRDAKSKSVLNSDNPADRTRMAAFIEAAAAAGATGIGHAPGYMGTTRTHIGGGSESVWGEGASRRGAPAWVVQAFERGRRNALRAGQLADALAQMRQAARAASPARAADPQASSRAETAGPATGGFDGKLKTALQTALRLHEIGTESPYKLFFAAKGKSGASFGAMQGDLAAGQDEVQRTFRDALKLAGISNDQIERYASRLSVHTVGNPLSEAETKQINDALLKAKPLVDEMDEQIQQSIFGDVRRCIQSASEAGRNIEPKALLYMACWINMSGPPSKLLDWLAGRDPDLPGGRPPLGSSVTAGAMEAYLRATRYYQENPGNLPHMLQSVAEGATRLG